MVLLVSSFELFEVLGKVAGIGGISIGVILVIFKEIISKKIFPRLTKLQAYRIIRLITVLVFVIAFLGVASWTILEWKKQNVESTIPEKIMPSVRYTNKVPKIIGIYPNDLFGPSQRKGLTEAVGLHHKNVEIIHLDFLSFLEMKSDSFKLLLDTLSKHLAEDNILAISGPSITECTDDVLRTVSSTKSKVPVFISSAAPRDFLEWDAYRKHINLYRIGTGVDDRAESLATFLKEHSNIRKTAVLVETNITGQKTYGEIFLDQILLRSPNFSTYQRNKKIEIFYYDRHNLQEYDSIFDEIKERFSTVFVLGVGDQFKHTIDKYYKGDYLPDSLPKFGGWMFGYALNNELTLTSSRIVNNKVFEITDLNLNRANDLIISGNLNVFMSKFDGFHPGLRDEAFSFDAGNCVMSAYKELESNLHLILDKNVLLDSTMLSYYNKIISHSGQSFDGVSNRISFLNGLNRSRSLSCAIYDSVENHWKHISNVDLLEL